GLDADFESVKPEGQRHGIVPASQEFASLLFPLLPGDLEIRERCIEEKSRNWTTSTGRTHDFGPGLFRCQSVWRSKTRAVRNNFSSANGAASSWRPIGRLALVNPQGMLIPGMPARLAVIV